MALLRLQPEYPGESVRAPSSARPPLARGRGVQAAGSPSAGLKTPRPFTHRSWIRWTFAAKTTVSALLALLIAFTFNLDQPKWVLLTVFIVAQPQSGLVLAKSFYRVIGTLIGAAVALFLVALFAQERVLFLGALAVWIGFCTFASKHARNFASYGFVLSGYTAAIVGMPGALDPGNAFYVAVARITEISLGIIVTATISHLVLPVSLAASLRQAIAGARAGLADYALALLRGGDAGSLRTKLLGQAVAIENRRASAIFEDREMRDRSDALQRLNVSFTSVVGSSELLGRQLDALRRTDTADDVGVGEAIAEAAIAVDAWRRAAIHAADFGERLLAAGANLPPTQQVCRDASVTDAEVIRRIAVVARLCEFFASLAAYAHAYEAFASGEPPAARRVRFTTSNDRVGAVWAGLRAALAVVLVGTFWIIADWPSGPTAAILAAVVTARLATMEHAGPAAIAGTLVLTLATVPAFILIEILLPRAAGFEMFTLAVAPVLFLCAFLMAEEKSPLAYLTGFLFALDFASVGAFQDRMTYDAIGFVNTSIAVIFAIAVGAILFAVVAPETPQAARRRFARAARQALARIAGPRLQVGLAEFETAMTEALEQLRGQLHPQGADDLATWEASIALLGAGRELIRLRSVPHTSPSQRALEMEIAAFAHHPEAERLKRIRKRAQVGAAEALADLRDGALGVVVARATALRIVAFSAIGDELERGGAFLVREAQRRTNRDAA